MTAEQWLVALGILFGAGGIGGAIFQALTDAWKERRAARRKREDERLRQQQAEDAGRRAAEQKWQELGLKHVQEMERRLTEAEKKADDAERRADKAEERADKEKKEADDARQLMQAEIDRMSQKQQERDGELAQIRTVHNDTLARLERETAARQQAEDAKQAAIRERDTEKLERTKVERQLGDIKKQLAKVLDENAELRKTVEQVHAENAAMKRTVSEQAATITSQGKRITELEAKLPPSPLPSTAPVTDIDSYPPPDPFPPSLKDSLTTAKDDPIQPGEPTP